MIKRLYKKIFLQDISRQLRLELLDRYVDNHTANLYGVPVACIMFGLIYAQWTPWTHVINWVTIACLTSMISALVYKNYRIARENNEIDVNSIKPWLWAIGVPRFIFILCWSSTLFWAWDTDIPTTFVAAFLPVFGTMAINAATSGPFLPFFFMETVPKMLAMIGLPLIVSGSIAYTAIAQMAAVGVLFILKIAFNIHETTKTLYEQKHELTDAKNEIEEMANTDHLTGVNNRRFFMQRSYELIRAQRYNRPLSVLIMDIDHFKYINDTYGHTTGDKVLRIIAQACSDAVRDTDYFVQLNLQDRFNSDSGAQADTTSGDPVLGRIGGEEFAMILPETNAQGAYYLAERLRNLIAGTEITTEDGEVINVTASFGITTLQMDTKNETINALLTRADDALYQAKEEGRNVVIPDNIARDHIPSLAENALH